MIRNALLGLVAAAIFVLSWFFRYNQPEGGFAGLLDDHYFYVVRGWQMLYGELPDRDFVDIGAPLTFALSAAAQLVLGRGALSEILMAVTFVSAAAALSFYAAARASGSILAALAATLFHIALGPRLYNYPKVFVYAVAIPVTWRLLDRPSWPVRWLAAAITVIGFLLRHDHGVFVGVLVVGTLLFGSASRQQKAREVLLYAALVLLLVSPYLVYLAVNGGIVTHFVTANAWSMRDRGRAPLVWPGFVGSPLAVAPWSYVGANFTAWTFYLLVLVPFVSAALLAWSHDAWRGSWPNARAKLAGITLLGLVLNAGFLRGSLAARLADVIVPHTVLIAWLLAMSVVLLARGVVRRYDRTAHVSWPLRTALPAAVIGAFALTCLGIWPDLAARMRGGHIGLDPGAIVGRAQEITDRFDETWPLDRWTSREARGSIRLVYYLDACTSPTDRVFVSPYLPQVVALSRRRFAAGHPDLRPGFFATEADEALLLARFREHEADVPIAILPPIDEYPGFAAGFPRLARVLEADYRVVGERDLTDNLQVTIAVRRDLQPTSTYEPLDLPCFR